MGKIYGGTMCTCTCPQCHEITKLREQISALRSDVLFFARMLDGAFDLERMAAEGTDEQKAAATLVRKYLQSWKKGDRNEDTFGEKRQEILEETQQSFGFVPQVMQQDGA